MRICRKCLILAPCLVLVAAALFAAEKEPQTFPTSKDVGASCDAAWPAALQTLTAEGWAIKTSDRAGGLLTLEWTRGESLGRPGSQNKLVGQHTTEKSTGFWTQYEGFRIVSGQFIAAPKGNGCSLSLNVTYHGLENRVTQGGRRWWVLRSNGWLEDQTLGKIAGRLSP